MVKRLEEYERATEYLIFISKLNGKLKHSGLMDRFPLKNIMQLTANETMPKLDMILNRVQTLTSNPNRILLDNLKTEIYASYKNEAYSKEEKKVLKYALAGVLSSINRLRSREQEMLVVEFKSFLDHTIDKIDKWKYLAKISVRDIYKTNYENNLKKKIDQANNLISILNEDIKAKTDEIHSTIADSISEIKKLRNESFQQGQIFCIRSICYNCFVFFIKN